MFLVVDGHSPSCLRARSMENAENTGGQTFEPSTASLDSELRFFPQVPSREALRSKQVSWSQFRLILLCKCLSRCRPLLFHGHSVFEVFFGWRELGGMRYANATATIWASVLS